MTDTTEAKPKRVKPKSRPERWAEAVAAGQEALSQLETALAQLEPHVEAVNAALATLEELKDEYAEWQGNLPENMSGSETMAKLEAITSLDFTSPELDLSAGLDVSQVAEAFDEAESADLPRGFGRD